MHTQGLNLLIPDKPDQERDALAAEFALLGGTVHRLARFWDPPPLPPETIRVYGPDSFCLVLQQKLGLSLYSPDDDMLMRVPPALLRRDVFTDTLAGAKNRTWPAFIKPVVPKQFRGALYASAAALAEECRGLSPDTGVLVSEIVRFTSEVRCFVLHDAVLDAAVYEGRAELPEAIQFATAVAQTIELPHSVVIDVGHIAGRGWGVVEFNAAWGAGLNGCDPKKVLPAILAASQSDSEPLKPA
ncbi:MAG: ATP-grasp domain-containing protein [Verrucomicrobia bacterium]|nr:ATP-grasp domain-containing protein [Verrucomicrobiota bacterium]